MFTSNTKSHNFTTLSKLTILHTSFVKLIKLITEVQQITTNKIKTKVILYNLNQVSAIFSQLKKIKIK